MTNLKKKIISFAVAVVLFIGCAVFASFGSTASIAGTAGKTSAKIETVSDLLSVLNFWETRDTSGATAQLVSMLVAEEDFEDNSGEELSTLPEHTSVTVNIKTNLYASSKSNNSKYTGGLVSSEQTLDRDLTLYMTEDATFYDSVGMTSVYSSYKDSDTNESRENSTFARWNMRILVDGDKSYVSITELLYSSSTKTFKSTRQLKSENVDKWYELPVSMVDDLIDVDYENREVLDSINDIFEQLIEEEVIDGTEEHISLDEQDFARIDDSISTDDYTLDFEVDLSNSTSPTIYSYALRNSSDTRKVGEYESVTIDNYIRNEQTLVFSNIDNTAIKFNTNVVKDTLSSEDEFEKLFIANEKEYKEDDDND